MPRRANNDIRRLGVILVAGAVAGMGVSYVASRRRPTSTPQAMDG